MDSVAASPVNPVAAISLSLITLSIKSGNVALLGWMHLGQAYGKRMQRNVV